MTALFTLANIRRAFDAAMLDAMRELMPGTPPPFVWLPLNADSTPDSGKVFVITKLNPGEVYSEELGGPRALSRREGTYIVTQSIPKGRSLDTHLIVADGLEKRYRRQNLATGAGHASCEEPYTTNAGQDQGRYVIFTTIPWYALFSEEEQ